MVIQFLNSQQQVYSTRLVYETLQKRAKLKQVSNEWLLFIAIVALKIFSVSRISVIHSLQAFMRNTNIVSKLVNLI